MSQAGCAWLAPTLILPRDGGGDDCEIGGLDQEDPHPASPWKGGEIGGGLRHGAVPPPSRGRLGGGLSRRSEILAGYPHPASPWLGEE